MGWLQGIAANARRVFSGAVSAAAKVINNPIIAGVGRMVVPGIYNTVKMGVGVASNVIKGSGASLQALASPPARVVAQAAPSIITVASAVGPASASSVSFKSRVQALVSRISPAFNSNTAGMKKR